MIYEIPRPPTVNSYYANNRGAGKGRYITERGATWKRSALNELANQNAAAFNAPAIVTVCVQQLRTNEDIDNRIKPTMDLLVKAGVLRDDNAEFVREVRARWVPKNEPNRVILEAV